MDTCDLTLGTDNRGSHRRQISDLCSVFAIVRNIMALTGVCAVPNACSFVIPEKLVGMCPILKKLKKKCAIRSYTGGDYEDGKEYCHKVLIILNIVIRVSPVVFLDLLSVEF